MIKKYLTLFLLLPILSSCGAKSTDTVTNCSNDNISENQIPFEYDFKMKKIILMPGTLNDSIHLKFLLETGSGAMVFPDNFACDFEKQTKVSQVNTKVARPMKVKIGKWVQTYGDSIEAFYLNRDNPIFNFTGRNVALIPWNFFNKKIIEISFSQQYIRELNDKQILQDYDSVRITIEKNLLIIPISIFLQSQEIKEDVILDTGSNGDISFNYNIFYKYTINAEDAYYGKSRGASGLQAGFSIPVDSIKVGKSSVVEGHYVAFRSNKVPKMPFAGLIGNRFFENFDIVLDLKDYYLYLKPINKQKSSNNSGRM